MRRFSAVEPLTGDHIRLEFNCSSEALNRWFRQHAWTAQRAETSRVFVVRRTSDEHVIGFYALSGGAVRREDATQRLLKAVGGYPEMPVVVLTRLAVDRGEEGQGLGRALLKDAFLRVEAVADHVGFRALLIHAEDERAASFYLKIAAFERSPTDDLHLILLLKDLRQALGR